MIAVLDMITWFNGQHIAMERPHSWVSEDIPLYYPHGNDGLLVVFSDGHVERLTRQEFKRPTETFWRRWNRDNESHPETWKPGG